MRLAQGLAGPFHDPLRRQARMLARAQSVSYRSVARLLAVALFLGPAIALAGAPAAVSAVPVTAGTDPVPAPASRAALQLSDDDRDEVERGREADRQIEAEFGFYEDDALAAYVDRIGQAVAAVSERPQLPWQFRVLDSPAVNAFAIPGGFVYVTRGLLAHMNSEAELAGVLGHEVGHITGKHAEARQRRSLFGTLGLLGLSILAPEAADFALRTGIAQNVLGLVLLKYSRDQELDADERGIGYATAAGYDPRGIGAFFETLQSIEERSDRKGLPGWLSTHPQVDDRIERGAGWAAESLAAAGSDPDELVQGRTAHLLAVDGIVFGENPREGFTRGDDFLHPDLRFAVTFPTGWTVRNSRQAVMVDDPDQRALIKLTLAPAGPGDSPSEYARAYLRQIRARVSNISDTRVDGLPAAQAVFQARGDNTIYAVYGLWVEYDGRLYELLGVTTPRNWNDYRRVLQRSLTSFRRLNDPEVLAVVPARVEVVRSSQAQRLRGVVEAHPETSVEPDVVALINQRDLEGAVEAGELVKLVTGGPRDQAGTGGAVEPAASAGREDER